MAEDKAGKFKSSVRHKQNEAGFGFSVTDVKKKAGDINQIQKQYLKAL